jgi:hypothetical protein
MSEVAAAGCRKVSRVQEWVSRTKQLLQSQSSCDHLTSPEVLVIVMDFKDVLQLHPWWRISREEAEGGLMGVCAVLLRI